ncbi:hypothetical protein BH11PSE10_BH11PSE10_18840 [soil metagenome]
MARVLSVWELGSGLGHIDRMLSVGRALRERGHEPMFLLKDLSRAHIRLGAAGFWFSQSPLWLPKLNNAPALRNYTVVLAAGGWLNPLGLAGLVQAWRGLFDALKPDALVCDHAPTAMLAARGQGLPVLAVGNSFEMPPPGLNFPPMAYWDPAEHARCNGQDELLLASANKALGMLGEPPLARLTELFDGVQRCMMSLPEFTHYPGCAAADLVGPAFVADVGVAHDWPASASSAQSPRVFAYLDPSHAQFDRLMAALKALAWPTLVYAKGMSAEAAARLGSASLHFETQPLRLDALLAEARIAISHGSVGTVTAAALAGATQLALPLQMEQLMVSRRIEEAGVGLLIKPDDGTSDLAALLSRLAHEPGFARAAQALAARHAGESPQRAADRVVDRIEAALAARLLVAPP